MAMKLYSETDIQALADGVRALTGETGSFTLAEMAETVADYWGDFSPIQNSTGYDGNPYNNGLGYKVGYRTGSGGGESAQADAACTGFIPCVTGDTLRINYGRDDNNSLWYINMYKADYTQTGCISLSSLGERMYSAEYKVLAKDVAYIRTSLSNSVSAEAAIQAVRVKIIKGVTA